MNDISSKRTRRLTPRPDNVPFRPQEKKTRPLREKVYNPHLTGHTNTTTTTGLTKTRRKNEGSGHFPNFFFSPIKRSTRMRCRHHLHPPPNNHKLGGGEEKGSSSPSEPLLQPTSAHFPTEKCRSCLFPPTPPPKHPTTIPSPHLVSSHAAFTLSSHRQISRTLPSIRPDNVVRALLFSHQLFFNFS